METDGKTLLKIIKPSKGKRPPIPDAFHTINSSSTPHSNHLLPLLQ